MPAPGTADPPFRCAAGEFPVLMLVKGECAKFCDGGWKHVKSCSNVFSGRIATGQWCLIQGNVPVEGSSCIRRDGHGKNDLPAAASAAAGAPGAAEDGAVVRYLYFPERDVCQRMEGGPGGWSTPPDPKNLLDRLDGSTVVDRFFGDSFEQCVGRCEEHKACGGLLYQPGSVDPTCSIFSQMPT